MLWPPKYYRGLSTRRKAERHREITRRKKMSWKDPKAYKPFKTDKGTQRRPSSYSSRFHKKYPEAKSIPEIAKATGVSEGTLRKVYNRGMAAWRTGHRPGATPQAWGMARVHSFVLHGKTWRTADADLSHQK
jgi:DNA-directed RNA polymerase specialized sigma24 family protein